jgi:hypothetical protein
MQPKREGSDPVNQNTLGGRWLAAQVCGQFLAHARHQPAFGETTVNDLEFIGAGMGTYFSHRRGNTSMDHCNTSEIVV